MQAVRSADFAIAQFRFLSRLILVHGRWNYRRVSIVILSLMFHCLEPSFVRTKQPCCASPTTREEISVLQYLTILSRSVLPDSVAIVNFYRTVISACTISLTGPNGTSVGRPLLPAGLHCRLLRNWYARPPYTLSPHQLDGDTAGCRKFMKLICLELVIFSVK